MDVLAASPETYKGSRPMFPNERVTDYRPQLKHYVVSVEGGVTEREYFNRIKKLFWGRCNITILGKKTESCPDDVIAHINEYRGKLLEGDEKWCVVDHDRWTLEQLGRLREWSESPDDITRGYAVSNPKFELWLLAHFRDLPKGQFGCVQLLKVYMPNYDKHIDSLKITEESVLAAISRGKTITPTGKPPLTCPGTNLWVLIERMSFRPDVSVAKCECVESMQDSGILVQDEFLLDDHSANK